MNDVETAESGSAQGAGYDGKSEVQSNVSVDQGTAMSLNPMAQSFQLKLFEECWKGSQCPKIVRGLNLPATDSPGTWRIK